MATRRCRIRQDDARCPDAPEYVVVFDDCDPCRVFGGVLFCLGHTACLKHTAMVRTNGYAFTDITQDSGEVVPLSGDATPVRVRTLEAAS